MDMIKVEYVGKKPFVTDNVAQSGKTWDGPGDVQEVTPAQAKILTSYTDQWALVDADDADSMNKPVTVTVEDKDGEEVVVTENDLGKRLEKMTATELAAYAKQKHGKSLNRNKGRKVLLDEVIALENGATHV